MAASEALTNFVERYHKIQEYEKEKDTLMREILIHYGTIETSFNHEKWQLTQRLHEAELDLHAATKARRELQQSFNDAATHIKQITDDNEKLKNTNPYILILIDGDGLIFQEHLVKQGLEGGKKAAYALRNAVVEYYADSNYRYGQPEIHARVVANISGLSKAMYRDGCVDDPQTFKEFTLGFTQAQASFDFIDVGYGKERADSKIRETTRWHLRNHNCKQILMGISHDSGYAPFLDQTIQDDSVRQRVTILKGTPLVRELEVLDFNVIDFTSDIFRSIKLVDKSFADKIQAERPATNGKANHALPSPPSVKTQPTLTPATSHASVSPPPGIPEPTWAKITRKTTPPPQLTLPLQPKPAKERNKPASSQPTWNPGPRGLDEPIKVNVTQSAIDDIKLRPNEKKFCNNHYLRGPCTRRDECPFVHNAKPTKDQMNALALLSRQNPCTRGQECDVENCIYGHHCPNVVNGACIRPYCRFPASGHPPGTKFANKNIQHN